MLPTMEAARIYRQPRPHVMKRLRRRPVDLLPEQSQVVAVRVAMKRIAVRSGGGA